VLLKALAQALEIAFGGVTFGAKEDQRFAVRFSEVDLDSACFFARRRIKLSFTHNTSHVHIFRFLILTSLRCSISVDLQSLS